MQMTINPTIAKMFSAVLICYVMNEENSCVQMFTLSFWLRDWEVLEYIN